MRAATGLLVTSYKITYGADAREPTGDNVAGIALVKQAVKLGETFSAAATTHQTVAFASHLGASRPGSSKLDDNDAPLPAMLTAVSGMLSGESVDAARGEMPAKPVALEEGKLPDSSSAVIAIAAKAGLAVVAANDLQLANGETITLMSGQDTQFVTGGQLRMHTGQAIGMLGGAVTAGAENIGLQLVAAKGGVDLQAQGDVLNVQARDQVDIISVNAHVDWAAAKSISLSTAGGANITIEGGNITVQCPGKITIHAAKKSFVGPEKISYPLPALPRSICVACLKKSLGAAPAFTLVE